MSSCSRYAREQKARSRPSVSSGPAPKPRRAFFGAKPEMVLVGGQICVAQMGDPNGSIPVQPVYSQPMWGHSGRASALFVSRAGLEDGAGEGLSKTLIAVAETRGIGKADMALNDALPAIEVDPETYEVRADGQLLTCEPATDLPLAQRYFLF